MDFRPDVDSHAVHVHMGFGTLTSNIEFICHDIEERRELERNHFENALGRLLAQELLLVATDGTVKITDTSIYGSFQYTIRYEEPEHVPAILLACKRASRLWWTKFNFERTKEVRDQRAKG